MSRKQKNYDPETLYATPPWCVDRLLDAVHLPPGRWLEPCAGDGAIIRAVNQCTLGISWTAAEVRAEAAVSLRQSVADVLGGQDVLCPHDFFSANFTKPSGARWWFDVVIMNPPFNLAPQFIHRCRELAPLVVVLLRSNYIGTGERSDLLRDDMPEQEWRLPDRPSFSGEGADSTEYSWFIWTQHRCNMTILRLLGRTPKDIRIAQRVHREPGPPPQLRLLEDWELFKD